MRYVAFGIRPGGELVVFDVQDPRTIIVMVQKGALTLAKVEISPGHCNRN